MTKTIQNISECRKLIREVNSAGYYTYADAKKDGKIRPDEEGNIFCRGLGLTSLKGAPKVVKGIFDCSHNELRTLHNGPKVVKGSFYCNYNKLDSLEDAPEKVKGDFYCSHNELTSLEGAPKEVEWDFDCRNNILKGTPEEIKADLRKISNIKGKIYT